MTKAMEFDGLTATMAALPGERTDSATSFSLDVEIHSNE